MRFREFIDEAGFEKTPEPYHDLAAGISSRQQLQTLGSGVHGSVYTRSAQDPTVTKIFYNDPGYARWLRWCWQHQNNKYVPQITPHADGSVVKLYKYYQGPGSNQRIAQVNLERLAPVDSQTVYKFSRDTLEYLDEPAREQVMKKFLRRRVPNYFPLLSADDLHVISLRAEAADPDLAQVVDFFARVEYSDRLGLDISAENIMLRPSTGQLVFTDPIVGVQP